MRIGVSTRLRVLDADESLNMKCARSMGLIITKHDDDHPTEKKIDTIKENKVLSITFHSSEHKFVRLFPSFAQNILIFFVQFAIYSPACYAAAGKGDVNGSILNHRRNKNGEKFMAIAFRSQFIRIFDGEMS